jgi:hypothetical protein
MGAETEGFDFPDHQIYVCVGGIVGHNNNHGNMYLPDEAFLSGKSLNCLPPRFLKFLQGL